MVFAVSNLQVTIQLYETYSPAMQALFEGMSGEEYLQNVAAQYLSDWMVNFNDPKLTLQGLLPILVPQSQFLIGRVWGFTGPGGSCLKLKTNKYTKNNFLFWECFQFAFWRSKPTTNVDHWLLSSAIYPSLED